VNGSYLQDELEFDDERFEIDPPFAQSRLRRKSFQLPTRSRLSMAQATGLPAFQYPTTLTTTKVGASGLCLRSKSTGNAALRCPVVIGEPYVMNSKDGFARIEAGDYDGTKEINGVQRKSIFREYATAWQTRTRILFRKRGAYNFANHLADVVDRNVAGQIRRTDFRREDKRMLALLEFLSNRRASRILWRGKSSGSCVGRPKRCRRSTIAFTSAVTKPAFLPKSRTPR